MIEATVAAALSWLGAALLALSDGRRGAAMSLAVTAVGLALGTAGRWSAAGVLLAGGACAAAARLRGGSEWGVLPPGSTPRLVGSLAVLGAGLVVTASTLGTPAGLARLGALVVVVLAAGRLLTAARPWMVLAAGSALALGLGALGGPAALVAGGLAAAALGMLDIARPAGVGE